MALVAAVVLLGVFADSVDGGRQDEACAALAARLGCADWSVAELCPDLCANEQGRTRSASKAERTDSAPAAAAAELPLLEQLVATGRALRQSRRALPPAHALSTRSAW